MKAVKNICLIILFFVVAASQNCKAQKVEVAVGESTRTLHFPADQSMGALYIEDGLDTRTLLHSDDGWVYFADAKGNVSVPADKRMRLLIRHAGLTDLSGLSALGPNDLYELDISACAQPPDKPDKTIMPYVGNLTGLKVLDVTTINITGKGLQAIRRLKSLRELRIESEILGDAGLSHLAGLKSLEILWLRAEKITDEGLSHLAKLTRLKELLLLCPRVHGPGLAHLAELPSLTFLSIMGGSVKGSTFGDKAMPYAAKLSSLKELHLGRELTNAGLAQLSNLTGIEELYCPNITDKGLVYLKGIASLKRLNVRGTRVTDRGLTHLKDMSSLESLTLPESTTDKGLAHVADLSNLKRLYIPSRITDEGLRHLANLNSLEELQIYGEGITDDGMSHVVKLVNLKKLYLENCSVTNAGLAKLTPLKSLKILHLPPKVTISGLAQLNALPDLINLEAHSSFVQDYSGLNIAGLTNLRWLAFWSGPTLRDDDLACLANLKRLEWLIINGKISDAGMAHLAGLTNLEQLLMEGSNLTDKGLSCVANMKKLMYLKIGGDFSDKALAHLEGLKGLMSLEITSKNDFSPEALQRLREKLPILYWLHVEKRKEK